MQRKKSLRFRIRVGVGSKTCNGRQNICLIDISPAESGHVTAHLMPEMIRHGDNLGLGPLHPGPGPGPVIDGETLLWHVYNVMLAAVKLKYSL